MVTLADLLYLGLFALILPLLDYAFFWPVFRRRAEADPARAKRWLYAWGIPSAWAMVAFGATIWVFHDRPWAALGFSAPLGWRLWVATALVVLLFAYLAYAVSTLVRDAAARASVRRQMGSVSAMVPSTQADLYGFLGVSLTAGFCEEFLFRGYLIWALSPWLGWWGAAALSLLLFASWHAYQGWSAAIRTAVMGALYTLVLAVCGSLWPVIVLHALVDFGSGLMAWLASHEPEVAA